LAFANATSPADNDGVARGGDGFGDVAHAAQRAAIALRLQTRFNVIRSVTPGRQI
jgi:hypothetical protein